MRCILALDQSTSATKALLFTEDGVVVDREPLEHRQIYPKPGWVEHDAEEIWANTLRSLRAIVTRASSRVSEIVGLSVTNQRETIVVFERGTGRPLYPAIVWQCRRSESLCAAHVAAGREDWVRARTGLKIDPYFSGSKLQWLVQNKPDLADKLDSGEALVGTIDAYLVYRFTKGAVFATDPTNASRTLLFDLGRLRWDEELCALWKVPMKALPEVRESFARFGETTIDGVLDRPLPICGVMGDSQAALFAHGCFERGTAKVTFGTGSSLLLNIGSDFRLSERGAVTALAWVRGGVPVYAFEGIIVSSASTLVWLRDQLRLIDRLEEVEALATAVPDNGGVYLVPAFSGLGFPHWAPAARATLVGLSTHSDRRHVVRAALEAIAYQIADALQRMRTEAGSPLTALHCDGGPTANRFLMQFTADMTGATLRVASMADCSALGAARAGLLGLGVIVSFDQLAALPRANDVYTPQLDRAVIARLEQGWQHAVRQTVLPQS
jgi:glycerol kinase